MWYLLNYVPPRGRRRAALPGVVAAVAPTLTLFAPTFVAISGGASPRRVDRPLLYHYIFVAGPEADVKRLCATQPGFSFVLTRGETRRRVTVDDATIAAFQTVARLHHNTLQCYDPADITLSEGDQVEIVTGPFAGLHGSYISRRGGKKGNVYVAVAQALGTVLYDIPADCVRVIAFAPGTHRPYDQIDAYLPRLLAAIDAVANPSHPKDHADPFVGGREQSSQALPSSPQSAASRGSGLSPGRSSRTSSPQSAAPRGSGLSPGRSNNPADPFVGGREQSSQALLSSPQSAAPRGSGLSPDRPSRTSTSQSAAPRGSGLSPGRSSRTSSPQSAASRGSGLSPGRSNTAPSASLLAAFTRRFATVTLGSPKIDAKLQAILYASYRLLGRDDDALLALERYRRLAPAVTNPRTLALISRLLSL